MLLYILDTYLYSVWLFHTMIAISSLCWRGYCSRRLRYAYRKSRWKWKWHSRYWQWVNSLTVTLSISLSFVSSRRHLPDSDIAAQYFRRQDRYNSVFRSNVICVCVEKNTPELEREEWRSRRSTIIILIVLPFLRSGSLFRSRWKILSRIPYVTRIQKKNLST